uniref:Uncharacterized protein n=1 Tax=Rhizophora mucronata TaxID=61149 RepID=A0A2P2QZU3_RHIMU
MFLWGLLVRLIDNINLYMQQFNACWHMPSGNYCHNTQWLAHSGKALD